MNADSVRKTDARILELAKYEASKGGLRTISRHEISEQFRYFKGLVMRHEMTVDELDDLVRTNHGAPEGSLVTLEDFGLREATPSDLSSMPHCEVVSTKLLTKEIQDGYQRSERLSS